jgi:hydrogenase expression/formation protein HypC
MCLAIPGKIKTITEDNPILRTGEVSFSGAVREVNLGFVPEAKVGDYVLVHAGIAINIIDSREAEKVFAYLDEIEKLHSDRDDSR